MTMKSIRTDYLHTHELLPAAYQASCLMLYAMLQLAFLPALLKLRATQL